MSEVMELEARLKNLISGEMQNIVKSIEDVTKKNEESAKKQKANNEENKRSVSQLSDSWNIAKIATVSLVSALGAMSILRQVTEWMKAARQENKEFLQTQYQLNSSLGYSSSALAEQIKVLEKKLVIDDDIIGGVQASISYFIKNESQIKRLTQATFDFAAATGMDANNAAMLLGRSIENGGILLSRYGIKIKATNDEQERAELIIDAVNRKFKDQAEMVSLSKDSFDRFGQTVKNVLQKVGEIVFNPWAFQKGDTEIEKMKNYYQKVLEYQTMYSAKSVEEAKLFLSRYTNEETGKRKAIEQLKEKQNQKEIETTQKVINEVLELTNEGKIKLLEIERDRRLKSVSNTEEGTKQKIEIERLYTLKIMELQKQISDETINQQKKVFDNTQRLLDSINKTYNEEVAASIESMKLLYEANEEDIKNNNESAERQERNISIIMNRKLKANEEEKKQKKEQDRIDKEATKNKVDNIEYMESATFSTIRNIAKASKASAAAQKTIDIAQATANMAIGIMKVASLGPAGYWQIPFIAALGSSQIALIASQKYGYGGIVPGTKTTGDKVPVMVNSREMILTLGQQANLFSMISRPNQINNNSTNQSSTNSNTSINLNITLGNNSNYDMKAANFTVEQLVPVIGEALQKAKNEGRIR